MAMVAETGYRQVQQRELPLPKTCLTTDGFECPTCLQQTSVEPQCGTEEPTGPIVSILGGPEVCHRNRYLL